MTKKINSYLRSIAALAVIFSGMVTCYSQDRHEVAVSAGGIFSNLDYDIKQGKLDNSHGFNVGLRYSYYLTPSLSVGLGAEYQYFSTTATFESLTDSYVTTDSEGESFEFRYTAKNVEEKQQVGYFNIPLTLQYEIGDSPAFYTAIGAKIGFALNQTFETSIEELSTSGYYPQYDAELLDPRFAGFGNFSSLSADKQDLDLDMSYAATFEAGIKQITDGNTPIYIGVFFDYGLNNILKKGEKQELVEYPDSVPVSFKYNSIINSADTNEVKLLAYGLKVRVGIL